MPRSARRHPANRGALAVLAAAALLLSGCASRAADAQASAAGPGQLRVVTTVAPLTSIVSSVAGDRARVEGLVPEGTNSHTFEPAPSAARALSEADLVFVNGLRLEEPTAALAEATMPEDARLVALGDRVLPDHRYIFDFSFPRAEGKPNPHLWTDPTYAVRYAEVVGAELSRADPGGAERYARSVEAFRAQAQALSDALRADQESVPPERRVLLTYHDAYAYFAVTYGWRVVGAIQPASFDDPSPREVAALIDQVRRQRVPTIFGSEVFPSEVLEEVGRATGARYEDTLRDDDLPGEPGDPEHSWAGLMRYDYVTMIEGLGGRAPRLRALDLSPAVQDGARYPQ